ncbi:MAG: WbqC family protein [Planctomycetes bacterium]|nr:WbqC family protein [Planctomycetota bacterium]NUQ34165.1 WbqC family protein [Planctomycetaceae bacterium]
MLVAGHQPNYLPYAGFFHKLAQVERFMVVDTVQFVKRGEFGWIHRNRIRTVEGWQWLSLPVLSKGKREQTCAEAQLNNQMDWSRKHWKAMEFNYKRAPHFKEYRERFEAVYAREWTHLTALSVELIRVIADAFGIATPIDLASQCGVTGEAHTLLENICRHYGANEYLSGVHGRDYLDLDDMKRRGITIRFQEFTHPVYEQCQPGAFEPNLSALDMLFNAGSQARELLLGAR